MPNRRRAFFWWALTLLLMVALAACGGAGPEPQVEEEPAAAEQEAAADEEEAAAEEEEPAASAGETPYGSLPADATAFPEAPEIDLGGTAVERVAIEEMVAYRALDEYHEPAWVTELVDAGELPPIEERLPAEPKVILAAAMSDGIGVYGDVWRDFSACPTAGWNNGAGVTSGWFGIESMSFNYQALVKTGPLFRATQDLEPFPNLAKSWEWSEDGLQLTMHN
jgi:peptide/nickel transport system substrate-binding protein